MNLKGNSYQYEELSYLGSAYRLLEDLYECGIEPLGSISHGVSYV